MLARTAPSGGNLQPGRFHALSGEALTDLSDHLVTEIEAGRPPVAEFTYFPRPMPSEMKARQREAGFALYSALGIGRRDTDARRAQFNRNYRFFDAPVGIVVTIDRRMGSGCFMDLGMAIQTLLLAAHGHGLGACGIGALANHGDLVHAHLDLSETEVVVCGIALGLPEEAHPANSVRTQRCPLDDIATFRGFED